MAWPGLEDDAGRVLGDEPRPTSTIAVDLGSVAVTATAPRRRARSDAVADRFPNRQLCVNLRGFDSAGPPMAQAEAVRGFCRTRGLAAAANVVVGHAPQPYREPCGCRKPRPCRSGGLFVFVDDAAEAVTSVDGKVGDRVGIGDRFWERVQGLALAIPRWGRCVL
jgi:hypothetical protein